MKYKACPRTTLTDGWAVIRHDEHQKVFVAICSEAEAKIIAFALNAVTNGHELLYQPLDQPLHQAKVVYYQDTTEGVTS